MKRCRLCRIARSTDTAEGRVLPLQIGGTPAMRQESIDLAGRMGRYRRAGSPQKARTLVAEFGDE